MSGIWSGNNDETPEPVRWSFFTPGPKFHSAGKASIMHDSIVEK
jgi:hypothetical protein